LQDKGGRGLKKQGIYILIVPFSWEASVLIKPGFDADELTARIAVHDTYLQAIATRIDQLGQQTNP
jgi:hypothetical protein